MSLKIIADDRIPLISSLFSNWGTLELIPGASIKQEHLTNADILLVRSITAVDQSLLNNTPIRFIGSATAGFDHIDTHYLNQADIHWSTAAGCNAVAVADYIMGCIDTYALSHPLVNQPRAGVIGYGHVGNEVVRRLKTAGFEVLIHDPPKAFIEKNLKKTRTFFSTPLEQFVDLDIICIHAALTHTGDFPSYHLINKKFLQQQKSNSLLINAARGAIVNTDDLLQADHLKLCLDVWENEPNINLNLLRKAFFATPHIAGYSKAAKIKASLIVYRAACEYFNIESQAEKIAAQYSSTSNLQFNPIALTQQMKKTLLHTSDPIDITFEKLRREYPLR